MMKFDDHDWGNKLSNVTMVHHVMWYNGKNYDAVCHHIVVMGSQGKMQLLRHVFLQLYFPKKGYIVTKELHNSLIRASYYRIRA